VEIEIRLCPSHQGDRGQQVADGWAKLAADEPDAHRVEWFSTTNPDGSVSERKFPLSPSLANVKRGFSEQKWADAKGWTRKQLARTRNRKYRPYERQKPDPTVAKANKRLASRFYQLKSGHCLTGQYLAWTTRRPDATSSTASFQELPPMEEPAEDPLDDRPGSDEKASRPHPVQISRSCSPTSGAARRYSTFSQTQTSAGRPAHRWQERKTVRLVRPRSGRREIGGDEGGG